MEKKLNSDELERAFWSGVHGNSASAMLVEVGDELNKVRIYANEHHVDDVKSKTVVHLALSSYYAGVSPLVRIESSLSLAEGLQNEHMYLLALRAYIEVAGRVHKGVRFWRSYHQGNLTIDELSDRVSRLLARYLPPKSKQTSLFLGKGYGIATLVSSLADKIPDIEDIYDELSGYVHGGFQEQMLFGKEAWLAYLQGKPNPIIRKFEPRLSQLREVVSSDFEILLDITKVFRARHDKTAEIDNIGNSSTNP